ncbi:hypothetical protein RM96_08975 [Cupriavidus sp. IDO]|nr:hypothetical protein RM96_08975 [Cupriavidus sp. IDO]
MVEIHARAATTMQAEAAVHAAFAEIGQIHRLMSRHDPDSDVSRFNRAPVGVPVPVDARTLAVLACAAALHAASDGAFDCERRPALKEGITGPGVAWQIDGNAVRKHRPVQLDLGGIAKGYAVDRAIAAMLSAGVENAVVNAGGDLRHAGAMPVAVCLRDPGAPARTALTWTLDNAALASSVAGGLFPAAGEPSRIAVRRGEPAVPRTAGATILAADCMLAVALTKVVLVCRAPVHPLLAAHGARTLLYRDGNSANA